MSAFSNLLSKLIQTENVNVSALTQYCGLDRSTMYKLINGKRSPASRELVQKITEFIHLNPWEQQQLLEAYEITRLGPEIYSQRRDIQKFILNLRDIRKKSQLPDAGSPEELPSSPDPAVPLLGKLQVSAAVHSIFRRAAAKTADSYKIGILAQPEHLEVLNAVAPLLQAGSRLRLDHIICFNNGRQSIPPQYNYNLQGLSGVIPFYGTKCQYQPYYYYDNVDSHHGGFNLMSCLFLTENEAVLCSSSLSGGYFFHSEKMIAPLKQHFQRLLSMARPMMLSFESSLEFQFQKLPALTAACRDSYSLSYEPCFGACMSRDLLEKYLRPELPDREHFLARADAYFAAASCSHNYFSRSGLEHFLKTGILHEIPPSLYIPPEYPDRVRMVKRFIALLEEGKDIRMFQNALGDYPSNFHLLAACNFGYLMFINRENHYSYLILEEPNLLGAFFDYASSLGETDQLATPQETRSFLQRALEKYGG